MRVCVMCEYDFFDVVCCVSHSLRIQANRRRRCQKRMTNAPVAVATARPHGCLRYVLGLSEFDVKGIERGGDKVLPGTLPSRYRGCRGGRNIVVGHGYRLLWWYWQALKRNHVLLAPFLAPYHAIRTHSYFSSMLLAKYAAGKLCMILCFACMRVRINTYERSFLHKHTAR